MALRLLFFLAIAVAAPAAAAQELPSVREGSPYFSHTWPWIEYDADNQNWGVAQGRDGLIYVANTEGLLEFDGQTWRTKSTPEDARAMVRSVAVDAAGAVFVGGAGEIGRLRADSTGTMRYASLVDELPADARDFDDVWTTHATPDGVVFQAFAHLMRWDGRAMRTWGTETRFRSAFLVDGVVHAWEEGVGIKRLVGDALELVPGGAAFAERKVDAVLPHARGLLLVVRDEGLVRLADGRERALDGPASDYLTAFRPYTAVPLPDPYREEGRLYAVSTVGGGVAIVDGAGRLVRVYREDVGLSLESIVVGLHADDQGGLWAATLNGVVRIDLFSRHTWFDMGEGLLGVVSNVAEHDGGIYATTSTGLYRLRDGRLGRPGEGPAYAAFEPVPGMTGFGTQAWQLLSTEAGLLVTTNEGTFVLEAGGPRQLRSGQTFALHRPAGAAHVLVGEKDGMGRLELRDGRWRDAGAVAGVAGEVRFFADGDRGVWAAELGGGLLHVEGVREGAARATRFGPGEGFDIGAGPLHRVGREVVATSREGAFAIQRVGDRVRLRRSEALADLDGVYSLFTSGERVWVSRGDGLEPVDGRDVRLRGVQPKDLLVTTEGVLWVASADGLLRYDPRVARLAAGFPAVIRRVADRQRRTLYGGALGWQAPGAGGGSTLALAYDEAADLRFEFSAAAFGRPDLVEFQTRVDGLHDDWSAWAPERVFNTTGLREGGYTLRVRARDARGALSAEAAIEITVRPPWYRTPLAYAVYFLAFVGFVWGVSAWRLREHQRKLDAARVRTRRLERFNVRLHAVNERLRQADRLKDDLLANTSHELRTPLTAILGFADLLAEEVAGDDDLVFLADGIQRGGQRLLGTVNALLDMFKLQSGSYEVHPQRMDVAAQARETVRLLAPLARDKGIALTMLPESLALDADVDPAALERILTNLLGNAIKFTDSGAVTLLVDGDDDELRFTVRDTGCGIAAEFLPRLFEPFEQASTGESRVYEGTGLGLAIVRRFVDLVGGSVEVESELGVGTTFRVRMPRVAAGGAVPGAAAPSSPSVSGVEVLAWVGPAAEANLRSAVEPHGELCAVDSLARVVRDARKGAFDVVVLAPGESRDQEAARVRAVRRVPGYERSPVLRMALDEMDGAALRELGYSGQIAEHSGQAVILALLETLLSHAETEVGVA